MTDPTEIEQFAEKLAAVAADLCGGICTYHLDPESGTLSFRLVRAERVAGLLCRGEALGLIRDPVRDADRLAGALVKELQDTELREM